MNDMGIYLAILGAAVLAVGIRRIATRANTEVTMADFEVDHPVDAFDMPERDEVRWRRSYSGH